ncbi:unnamed protein product [Lactuca saligna]|uniref:Uncharacterized protein n=1 Tax=Lactuca saligna TaxID=75948 RepID=A0AA36A1L2_LACSI|nr:unnamed protein product [Lactuca saligna]
MSNVGVVSKDEVDKVRDGIAVVQNDKVVLESKLVGYDDDAEEVSTLKATVASIELEKTGLLDKIVMLEHSFCKLKTDLNESALQNTDLQAIVVGLESKLNKVNVDVTWVLSHGVAKMAGCEMMNNEFKMALHETDILLYDPSHVQKTEEAFLALFCTKYLSDFGFPLTSVDQLRTLVDGLGGNVASTSGHGGNNES